MKKIVFLIILTLIIVGGFLFNRNKDRINLLFVGKKITVISLVPTEKELVAMPIPDNLMLEVINGYGQYQAGSIYQLGQQESRGIGLLINSLSQNLGIIFDGYFLTDFPSRRQMLFKPTNFKIGDRWRIWRQLNQSLIDQATKIDLISTGTTEQSLADKSKILMIKAEDLDLVIKKHFKDQRIVDEDLDIRVLNGTDHFGLGQQAARIMTNFGGRLIQISQAEQPVVKSILKINPNLKASYTAKKISQLFPGQIEQTDNGLETITLILGEDYFQFLHQKPNF